MAGYRRSTHANTSQEWRGAAETPTQAHTPTPHTPPGIGGLQAERAHGHTHSNTPSRNGRVNAKTGTKTQAPQTPARIRGRHRVRAHQKAHPNNPAGTREESKTITHTYTPQNSARDARSQAERAHKHTHPNTPARTARVKATPEPRHTHHQPQQELAVRGPNPLANAPTAHPNQDWRDTGGARAQTHTLQHYSQAQLKHTHLHNNPQPGKAGLSQSSYPRTHTLDPSKEWRG